MRGDDEDEDDDDDVWLVDVLPQCLLAVEVFQCCQLTISAGMAVFVQGFSAAEIESACRLLRIPRRDRPQLLADLMLMGKAAADYMNKQRPKGD